MLPGEQRRAEERSDPGPCHAAATEEVFPPQGCVRCGLYSVYMLYSALYIVHMISPQGVHGCDTNPSGREREEIKQVRPNV